MTGVQTCALPICRHFYGRIGNGHKINFNLNFDYLVQHGNSKIEGLPRPIFPYLDGFWRNEVRMNPILVGWEHTKFFFLGKRLFWLLSFLGQKQVSCRHGQNGLLPQQSWVDCWEYCYWGLEIVCRLLSRGNRWFHLPFSWHLQVQACSTLLTILQARFH